VTGVSARSPFLDLQSFTATETEIPQPLLRVPPAIRSPFLSVYKFEEGESGYNDPVRETVASFMHELHDEEFDEALFEVQSRARALHDEQLAAGVSRPEADRLVAQHFSQLVRESEAMVDAMAREFEAREGAGILDHEVESFAEGYTPSENLEPEFENLFGKILGKVTKAVKSAAGAAWKGIKKVALGPILSKIKALIRPLLNSVLQKAIGRLPVPVQPAAQKLAQKLGFAAPPPPPAPVSTAAPATVMTDAADAAVTAPTAPDAVGSPVQATAATDAVSPQEELDQQIAEAFLAEDEVELNLEVAQARSNASQPASPVFAELDDARERFIRELEQIKEGESAEPYIQNFLPAVLPVLSLGMRVLGRNRVVGVLSGLLSQLISKLIGPAQAPALSRAIVDAGLKLVNLEMSEEERSGLAASAVAATVEETAARVASLPDHVLDNQELLEGFALEAFEQAAAANLPGVFSEATYRQRPELLEGGVNAGWVLLPLRGPKRYKRCSRMFKVRVTPHMAEEVESFEDAPLSEYLTDQLGLPVGAEVEGEMYLYETLPGTTVADIARGEAETIGTASAGQAAAAQIHPLTPQAASVLIGKPGLGRALSTSADRQQLPAGQRLYHLAISGRRPLNVLGHSKRPRIRRLMRIHFTLNSVRDEICATVFFSEVKAQRLAVKLREQANLGSVAAAFHKRLARSIGAIFRGRRPRRIRLTHAGLRPGVSAAAALRNVPATVSHALAAKTQEWLLQGFTDFMKSQLPKFLTAAENPADGVTMRFVIQHPPGLKEFCQALVERGPAAAAVVNAIAQGAKPTVLVEVFPGHTRG
jgi:hypothetical protein